MVPEEDHQISGDLTNIAALEIPYMIEDSDKAPQPTINEYFQAEAADLSAI